MADKLDKDAKILMPFRMIPSFKTSIAVQDGVERNLIFKTWGGIGDQICAEPTLRFALKMFKDCDVSLASEQPDLFRHLNFKKVFNLKQEIPVYDNYLSFETITPPDHTNLVWQFFSHLLTNCVDFPSLCALRMQLPVEDREVILDPKPPKFEFPIDAIVVHPGRHWASKTFPVEWWNAVLKRLKKSCDPIIIGADTDDNRGTVDVDTSGCIDFRNRLSINDSIFLLLRSKVLLTNDSSPLHMAVPGNAWIGYVATCKHPDNITHWRKGQWGWRMRNHGKGGIWEVLDYCPNKENEVTVEKVDPDLLLSWLPDPVEYATWAIEKFTQMSDMRRQGASVPRVCGT